MVEKRLIDADAMRDDWLENGENEYVYDTNAVLDSIDSQPTIDAVPVVRCKDCEYFGLNDENVPYCLNPFGLDDPEPNGFCNYGIGKN